MGAYYFKYFRLKEGNIRERRLFEGRLLFEEMRYLFLTITASCLLNMLSIAKRKGKEMKLGPYGGLGPFYRKNH